MLSIPCRFLEVPGRNTATSGRLLDHKLADDTVDAQSDAVESHTQFRTVGLFATGSGTTTAVHAPDRVQRWPQGRIALLEDLPAVSIVVPVVGQQWLSEKGRNLGTMN